MLRARAAIFDLGKVLVDFDYGIMARALSARSDMSGGELRALLDQSSLLHRYESGAMTTREFFAEVQSRSGFRGTLDEFAGVFADIFTPIAPMVALLERLVSQGVPTFAFSNTNELAVRHLRARFPFMHQFNALVLSYEHGAMKPDPRLYEAVEGVTTLRGGGLFYLDDRPENIETAQTRGWQAVLHETPEKSIEAARRAGVLR